MRALASFVMRGRMQASLVSATAAILSLLLSPLSILSAAVVALVTLRKGAGEGGLVLIGSLVGGAFFAQIALGSSLMALMFLAVIWLPAWCLALYLRQSVSLSKTLELALLLVALALVVVYAVIGDPAASWRLVLDQIFRPILIDAQMGSATQIDQFIISVAGLMTAMMAVVVLASLITSVLLARWWQAQLYNPGGFKTEFHELRFRKGLALVSLLLVVISLVLQGRLGALVGDLVLVAGVLLCTQGLSLMHGLVGMGRLKNGWLIAVYVLMFIATPHVMMGVALMGLLDIWFDFRGRLKRPHQAG